MAHKKGGVDEPIPEPAIWFIFESLVIGGLLMSQGHPTTPVEDWIPIVHRDVKPDNVFVGDFPQPPPIGDREWSM